jgi:uncharacterized protein DUF559
MSSLDLRRPFTRADAVAAGVDPRVLRTSRFRRLFRGVYVSAAHADEPWLRTAGALALHPPDAFASHHSAARLLGLPVPGAPVEHVSVNRAQDRRSRAGIVCHVAPVGSRVVERQGLRVSAPRQIFRELAGVLSLVDLVVLGDALVRLFPLTAADLRTSFTVGRAGRAAAYVRDGVGSPMETRLRLLIVLAGLPEPVVDHVLWDAAGGARFRLDLAYVPLRVAVEYDGRQHAHDTRQWRHDLRRREWLDAHGWRLVVVTAEGIYRDPVDTLVRVRAALAARTTSVPRRLDEGWRGHFPC